MEGILFVILETMKPSLRELVLDIIESVLKKMMLKIIIEELVLIIIVIVFMIKRLIEICLKLLERKKTIVFKRKDFSQGWRIQERR